MLIFGFHLRENIYSSFMFTDNILPFPMNHYQQQNTFISLSQCDGELFWLLLWYAITTDKNLSKYKYTKLPKIH